MHKRIPPTKEDGIEMAKKLQHLLKEKGFPIKEVRLFGSVAKGRTHEWSDIDIAVIHEPFKESRFEEMREMCRAEHNTDISNIEVVYFHPADMDNKYSTIVQEVKKDGIVV